jgi:hypothetical protein
MPTIKCDDCSKHFYPEDEGQWICETCIHKRLRKKDPARMFWLILVIGAIIWAVIMWEVMK